MTLGWPREIVLNYTLVVLVKEANDLRMALKKRNKWHSIVLHMRG